MNKSKKSSKRIGVNCMKQLLNVIAKCNCMKQLKGWKNVRLENWERIKSERIEKFLVFSHGVWSESKKVER